MHSLIDLFNMKRALQGVEVFEQVVQQLGDAATTTKSSLFVLGGDGPPMI